LIDQDIPKNQEIGNSEILPMKLKWIACGKSKRAETDE
jgi:hypothetical protein